MFNSLVASNFLSDAFDWLAGLSSKLPQIDFKTFFIVVAVALLLVGVIIALTHFGSSRFKLFGACMKIRHYLGGVDCIDDDNVGDFTAQCFSVKAPATLRDCWVQYLGVRFGYPSNIVSHQNVYDKEVKRTREIRANIYMAIALILIAAFAFWGYGTLESHDMGLIFCVSLILAAVVYLVLVLLNRLQTKLCLAAFDDMLEDLDAKVTLQVEKSYATDSSPLAELAAMVDVIVARNTAKDIGFDVMDEETPIEHLINQATKDEDENNSSENAEPEKESEKEPEKEPEPSVEAVEPEPVAEEPKDNPEPEQMDIFEDSDLMDTSDDEPVEEEPAQGEVLEEAKEADEASEVKKDDEISGDVYSDVEIVEEPEKYFDDSNVVEANFEPVQPKEEPKQEVASESEPVVEPAPAEESATDKSEETPVEEPAPEPVPEPTPEPAPEPAEEPAVEEAPVEEPKEQENADEPKEESKPEEEQADAAPEEEKKPVTKGKKKVKKEIKEAPQEVEDDSDDEIVKPAKLVKLTNLVDYTLQQNLSHDMLVNLALILLSAYEKFKHSPDDKAILKDSMKKVLAALTAPKKD